MSLFLTGTDTGVGKTYTAARLLQLLRASGASCAGMKPICCGDRRDAELLLAAGCDGLTIDHINPVWLKTPAAPIVGSLIEKTDIHIENILAAFHALQNRVEQVIVEGAGGWIVPIGPDFFISDLAAAMKLPVLAVAYNRLGLSQSFGAHCPKHCGTRTPLCGACIEQRARCRRHSRFDQCRYSQKNS